MRMLIALLLLSGPWFSAMAAPALAVQKAIKLLPPEQAKNLIRIEAREGTPLPERWYIQVYDPDEENGLHEFVVSQKEIVASRPLSQFLTEAKPGDVVGAKLVKIDSDDLVSLARKYAEANKVNIAKINYTMLKEATNPSPVWKLACFDDSGKKLGELVINARNANIVSHEGFELAPGQSAKPSPAPVPAATPATPAAAPVAADQGTAQPAVPVARATAVKPSPSPLQSPAPGAGATPKPKTGLFQRMFHGKPTPTPMPVQTPVPAPRNP